METFMKSEELGSIYIWKPLIWTDGNNVPVKDRQLMLKRT